MWIWRRALSGSSWGLDLRLVDFWLELIYNVLCVFVRKCYELRMTPSRHNFVVLVDEFDGSKC